MYLNNSNIMGIPRFFPFIKNNFSSNIIGVKKRNNFPTNIDNFMIDLNGLFHDSTQKIYEYGSFKPHRSLMRNPKKKNLNKLRIKVFEDVCNNIEELFIFVNPKKRLVLCVDGPAPQSKQCQQRSRRFRSAMDRNDPDSFDGNCLSPGTQFMDYLTKYIDWYIKKRISENEEWQKIEVIFSSEKVAGEGEQKIISYIRDYGILSESFCIHGMDADIIMLSLATHAPNIYILRKELYDTSFDFFLLNIGAIRTELKEILRWEPINTDVEQFDETRVINDFVFVCFIIGNDFLPHIPSIEIIEGGLEVIIDVYKTVCSSYGHMTRNFKGNIVFSKKALKVFFGTINTYEKKMFENKLDNRRKCSFFKDTVLDNNSSYIENKGFTVDIENYHIDYYGFNFVENIEKRDICLKYLEGLQWVLTYYTKGVPDWNWFYPYHYAPFSGDIAKCLHLFRFTVYETSTPNDPFQQLLSILPPTSSSLLPEPLSHLLSDISSPLKIFCPNELQVDLSGKRKEYEGVVLLPFMDKEILKNVYSENLLLVNGIDIRRNSIGKSYIYSYDLGRNRYLTSYYGDIKECKVKYEIINL